MKGRQVGIVIPVFNRKDVTLLCLKQLRQIEWGEMCPVIIIVDDGSTDGTGAAVRERFPDVMSG